MQDLISRQAAIDAECEVCRIAPKKERGHNCIYYVNGCKVRTAGLYGYRVPPEQWAGWINGKGGEIKLEEIWKDRPHIILYGMTVRRYIIPMNDRGMLDFMAAEEDRRGAARFNRLFHEEDDTEERVYAGLQDGVKQIAQMFRGKKGQT